MKRRRRYGEKYSGLPYPEDFKNKMMAQFPNSKKEEDSFTGCLSRRYSDHAEIEAPPPMLRLLDDFEEGLQK